jgi:hypothetical protein
MSRFPERRILAKSWKLLFDRSERRAWAEPSAVAPAPASGAAAPQRLPGATPTTRMPCVATSTPAVRVSMHLGPGSVAFLLPLLWLVLTSVATPQERRGESAQPALRRR